ncbi:NAD(P)/FAD-dependent oxidoreductase [Aureliella helgolandensis]|uniref:Flavin-binding monooxygenase-like protein n=1 Tax=Aureliella helgolandensis TaxID=2527968 RepID=A0A518GAM3_9BACT|nr:NAD(P)/FAD-dependent oxidoreductase [Aureliella helgolandensis]QDV25645.1 Flavin-binding monooxygenase-like protein [Aureliella helgolandensis]
MQVTRRKRLAIIGAGSSGLVSLKTAIEVLPNWEIVCFEKSSGVTGCWGNPYPNFVSTSTKYTTQFACFPVVDASVHRDGGQSRSEFFCNDEYGQYLEAFAAHFSLYSRIRLGWQVRSVKRVPGRPGWALQLQPPAGHASESLITEEFDSVILCTGLVAQAKEVDSQVPSLPVAALRENSAVPIQNQCLVVLGGGESAVDLATRLSRPRLQNDVYLSVNSGIRVSPRYHPIRGVPSDFLRNRLMLSIHVDIRNWIGKWFVRARILFQERFERWFPARENPTAAAGKSEVVSRDDEWRARRKAWDYRLTRGAKAELFDMFHNKSDDFLDAVADGHLKILGAPINRSHDEFKSLESEGTVRVAPDWIVPAIGYASRLQELLGGDMRIEDFYLGCCHPLHRDLFAIGFARPIIGNIPTISEMQARYVCGLIAGEYQLPENLPALQVADLERNRRRYAKLNLSAIYPVEMIPYCDRLAREMGAYPTLKQVGSWWGWCRIQWAPSTTMHYYCDAPTVRQRVISEKIYMPAILILLLLLLKPIDAAYRCLRFMRAGGKRQEGPVG